MLGEVLRRIRPILAALLALALLVPGAYALTVFELATKVLAAAALVVGQSWLCSAATRAVFCASGALAAAACLAPAVHLGVRASARALRRRAPDWRWSAAGALLFFGVLLFAQDYSYRTLRAALPLALRPSPSNECPAFSVSGLEFAASKALGIAPGLLIDVNNEQCTTLKLAHDTELGMDTDWEVFRLKAYDPAFVHAHYAQNAVFPLSVAFARAIHKHPEGGSWLGGLIDKADSSVQLAQSVSFVLEHQEQLIERQDPGSNLLSRAVARLQTAQERSILGGVYEPVLKRLPAREAGWLDRIRDRWK
jgi:hypothetical protein